MKWLLTQLVGADEFLLKAIELVQVRKAAQAQHEQNKQLRAELSAGEGKLFSFKNQHSDLKKQVESLYNLELD